MRVTTHSTLEEHLRTTNILLTIRVLNGVSPRADQSKNPIRTGGRYRGVSELFHVKIGLTMVFKINVDFF